MSAGNIRLSGHKISVLNLQTLCCKNLHLIGYKSNSSADWKFFSNIHDNMSQVQKRGVKQLKDKKKVNKDDTVSETRNQSRSTNNNNSGGNNCSNHIPSVLQRQFIPTGRQESIMTSFYGVDNYRLFAPAQGAAHHSYPHDAHNYMMNYSTWCDQRPNYVYNNQNLPILHTYSGVPYDLQNLHSRSFHSNLVTAVPASPVTSDSTEEKDRSSGYVESLRFWDKVSDKHKSKEDFRLTLMCYNVLAQDLITVHNSLYRNHHPEALVWATRWQNLLREIEQFHPDILCMQEVQESHVVDYYSELNNKGYIGIYKKRTGMTVDGCAIYFNSKKLDLVEYTTVEYRQDDINILNRDNVGIVARFVPINKKQQFVVATTHLLYNPKRQDVRLAQIQLLLTEIDRIAYDKSSNRSRYVPVIITGDFNSTPDSAVYKFLSNGSLTYEGLQQRTLQEKADRPTGKQLIPPSLRITDNCKHCLLDMERKEKHLARSEELELVYLQHSENIFSPKEVVNPDVESNLFSTGTLTHDFALKSVYPHFRDDDFEATTHHGEWITVDYILYSGKRKGDKLKDDRLKLISRYNLPTRKQLRNVRIPNLSLGSDHLSLIAKFLLKP